MIIIPEHIILETMQTVIDRWLLPKFDELGMNATGEWKENVHALAEPNKGIISGRNYTEQLVYGRKPGKMPPVEPLIRWAQAKFGVDYQTATQIAWGTAKKIQQDGTTWFQKGGSDLLEVLEQPEVIDYINSQIGNYLTAEVQLQFTRDLKEAFA